MRKRNADSSPVAIRFKQKADSAAEVELLMSVLPQLLALIIDESREGNATDSAGKLSLQQNNNLTLDNEVKSTEDMR